MSSLEDLDSLEEIISDDLTHFGAGPSAFYPVNGAPGQMAPNGISRPTSLGSQSNSPAILEQLSPGQNYQGQYAMVYTPVSPLSAPASPGENRGMQIQDPVINQLCAICGDRGTGKHYGANSCDGCKGFFRRTIRRNRDYTCRFNQECIIDRDHRNACRYCRFQKCLGAGMKSEAVQNERDRISPKRPAKRSGSIGAFRDSTAGKVASQESLAEKIGSPMQVASNDYIHMLVSAEQICLQLRSSVITRTSDQIPSPAETLPFKSISLEDKQVRTAKLEDVTESMHQQLLLMVEWAKTLPPFTSLPMEEQIALLRNFSAQFLMYAVAHRTMHTQGDALYLNNETVLPRDTPAEIPDVNHVVGRVLDELVYPMNQIEFTETEMVALKGIIFFNPICKGAESCRAQINETRQCIMAALQQYVMNTNPEQQLRFGNILLLLPPLQAIAQAMIEDIQLASLFGMTRIDSLLKELMLPEVDSGKRLWMFHNLTKGYAAAKWPKLAAAVRSAAASPENEAEALRAAQRAFSVDSAPTNMEFSFKKEK